MWSFHERAEGTFPSAKKTRAIGPDTHDVSFKSQPLWRSARCSAVWSKPTGSMKCVVWAQQYECDSNTVVPVSITTCSCFEKKVAALVSALVRILPLLLVAECGKSNSTSSLLWYASL